MTQALDPLVERLLEPSRPNTERRDLFDRQAAERIQAQDATITRLTAERDALRGLISEQNIERLAEDIAIACVDCRQEIREARHRAMVRLGERLRNPLPSDIVRATLKDSATSVN
jgi:hypothetical protein